MVFIFQVPTIQQWLTKTVQFKYTLKKKAVNKNIDFFPPITSDYFTRDFY